MVKALARGGANLNAHDDSSRLTPLHRAAQTGNVAAVRALIAAGAVGVISVVANAFPKEFSDMIRLCLAGDFEKARPLHYKYLEITAALFAEGSPAGIKAVLAEMGLCQHAFRLPVWPVSEKHQAYIKGLLQQLK